MAQVVLVSILLLLVSAAARRVEVWQVWVPETENLTMVLFTSALALHAFVNIGVFYWTLNNVDSHLETICPASEPEKLALFEYFRSLLYCCAFGGASAVIAECIWLWHSEEQAWKTEWMFTDLGTSLFFAWVLMVLMWLFRPSPWTYRFAYHGGAELVKHFGRAALADEDGPSESLAS